MIPSWQGLLGSRLTRDSRVSVVSLEIPGFPAIYFWYRKNDQEKISEIFVHVAPEKNEKKRQKFDVGNKSALFDHRNPSYPWFDHAIHSEIPENGGVVLI